MGGISDAYRPRILVSRERVQTILVELLCSINPIHDLQWPALRVADKNVGGVTRTSLCQKGVNRTTEGISDRTFLCSSVYSLALSERCNSTDMSRRSAQRRFGIAVPNLSTTDWVYIQSYPVLKSRR